MTWPIRDVYQWMSQACAGLAGFKDARASQEDLKLQSTQLELDVASARRREEELLAEVREQKAAVLVLAHRQARTERMFVVLSAFLAVLVIGFVWIVARLTR